MSVASTIAKMPISILPVTLQYGEDDMSHLYSILSKVQADGLLYNLQSTVYI